MQTENGAHRRIVENALLTHPTAPCSPLLGRLKQEFHRALELVAQLCQHPRRAHQAGDMAVVAAGVHLPRHRGTVRVVAQFFDRQCIHVGPQGDTGSGAFSAEGGHDTGSGDTGAQLDSRHILQLRDDTRRRLVLLVAQLRMPV